MPKHSSSSLDLMDIFRDFNPSLLGNGQIRMECPFRENHPDGSGRMSFFASPGINAYHCFSCGSHGSLTRLLVRSFGVNYFDAVGLVRLTDYSRPEIPFDLDVMWDFRKQPDEFLSRGYTSGCLRHFMVGTSDDGSILIPYYDSFETRRNLLGYQKRWYEPTRRVINSKGFDKKSYLYNFKEGSPYVVLVEGQSDVWRLHQYGYNACALMGSDISPYQVRMLSTVPAIYLALDNDTAGRRGCEICHHLLRNHSDVRLVPYDSKDPGECGQSEWSSAFSNSTDYAQYTVEMSLAWDGYLSMKEDALRDCRARDGY